MPEIVAAHLERVAREVHDAIERGYARWNEAGRCDPSCGCVTVYIEQEIKPLLAAALAACAREEREACKADIQDAIGNWGGPEREHYTQAIQRATDAIEKRAQGLDPWGRALERAVGEKGGE